MISGGFSTLMNGSMLADEIYANQDDDIERYIKDNLLEGSSFSEVKFCAAMETIDEATLTELLAYFDDRDMPVSRAYSESCIDVANVEEFLKL